MPTLIITLALALLVLITPVSMSPMTAARVIAPPQNVLVHHYIRGGVVQINTTTNATRFIPYRVAKEFDRRSAGAVAA